MVTTKGLGVAATGLSAIGLCAIVATKAITLEPENQVPAPAWTEDLSVTPGKYQCKIGVGDAPERWVSVNEAVSEEFDRVGSLAWQCKIKGPENTTCVWTSAGAPRYCEPS